MLQIAPYSTGRQEYSVSPLSLQLVDVLLQGLDPGVDRLEVPPPLPELLSVCTELSHPGPPACPTFGSSHVPDVLSWEALWTLCQSKSQA